MKLWHDDIRRPPDDTWTWARTNAEARELLETGQVTEASLDHDLGLQDYDPDAPDADMAVAPEGWVTEEGIELVRWMCETGHVPPKVTVHSWNPDGAKRMADALRDIGCSPIVRRFDPDWRSGR